ncbi:MAG TPA: V-type ATP synthase subunit I [Bacillota bacterium]|nr:V-type ATP synthase subunit I [Bacillota bacterium]
MAIAEMLRVTIVGLVEDSVRITEAIHDKGVIQIETPITEEPEKRLGEVVDLNSRALETDSLVSGLKSAIDFMDRQKQVKKGALGTFIGWHYRIDEDGYNRFVAGGEARAKEIAELCSAQESLINDINNELKRIDSEIEQLRPWSSLTLPASELHTLKRHDFYFLSNENAKKSPELGEIASGLGADIAYADLGSSGNRRFSVVALNKEDAPEALRKLSSMGFEQAQIPESTLPPALEIKRLETRKEELGRALSEASGNALKLCEMRPEAYCLHDHFANEKARLEAAGSFLSTESAFVLDGWVRKDRLEGLKKAVYSAAPTAVVMTRQPEEGEDVPVDLVNKGIFNPFEAVTRIMGLPKQGTIDPTPLLAVFFFIYFGTCMGDVVYGIIMTAIGILMLKKLKTAGMGTQLLQLLVVGGIATVVMGVMFGGYFGDLLSKYIRPLWFDPMSENGPLIFLGFSFGMGVVQILFGMAIKAWDNARNGRWLSAIYDQGFWVLLLLGVGLLMGGGALGPGFSSAGKWMSIVGAVGLMLTQGRHHKNPVVRLGSGIVSLYNITSYMSDIVSYSRLFGLGFTSIVIGMVINYMAKMMLGIPVIGYVLFAALLIFGHMFNLFINITGAFIHSSRLQYVEFFGKFADFGGSKFTPFRRFNKYVDIDFKEAN